jgi:hypothetical protein
MIYVFTGPAPLAQLVREELLNRGVAADLHSRGLLVGLYGAALAGSAGLQSVVVTEETADHHRAIIAEVLTLVSPVQPMEMIPAAPPRVRGDELTPADGSAERAPGRQSAAPPRLRLGFRWGRKRAGRAK